MVLKAFVITALLIVAGDPRAVRSEDPAATPLSLAATTVSSTAAALLEGNAAWRSVPEQTIRLNRTPPLYEGDPMDDGVRPEARVSLVRTGSAVLVRLTWSDSTESRPASPTRIPDSGHESVYKQHSEDIERFADAACVMVPKVTGQQASYPSLMMGDRNAPVDLFYWHLIRGFRRLEAAGRSTTTATGETFDGSAHYTGKGWDVIFVLPAVPPRTPVCFAVWDGDRKQRDGLKYYSLWYEVEP